MGKQPTLFQGMGLENECNFNFFLQIPFRHCKNNSKTTGPLRNFQWGALVNTYKHGHAHIFKVHADTHTKHDGQVDADMTSDGMLTHMQRRKLMQTRTCTPRACDERVARVIRTERESTSTTPASVRSLRPITFASTSC